MACNCDKTTRGVWSDGTVEIQWKVASKCESATAGFAGAPNGEDGQSASARREQQSVAQTDAGEVGGGAVAMCCVTYKIVYAATGLGAGEQIVMQFSAGDDSWGPVRSGAANAQGATNDRRTFRTCKEHANCTEQRVGKLQFEHVLGAAGQPAKLGTVGDILVCKLA